MELPRYLHDIMDIHEEDFGKEALPDWKDIFIVARGQNDQEFKLILKTESYTIQFLANGAESYVYVLTRSSDDKKFVVKFPRNNSSSTFNNEHIVPDAMRCVARENPGFFSFDQFDKTLPRTQLVKREDVIPNQPYAATFTIESLPGVVLSKTPDPFSPSNTLNPVSSFIIEEYVDGTTVAAIDFGHAGTRLQYSPDHEIRFPTRSFTPEEMKDAVTDGYTLVSDDSLRNVISNDGISQEGMELAYLIMKTCVNQIIASVAAGYAAPDRKLNDFVILPDGTKSLDWNASHKILFNSPDHLLNGICLSISGQLRAALQSVDHGNVASLTRIVEYADATYQINKDTATQQLEEGVFDVLPTAFLFIALNKINLKKIPETLLAKIISEDHRHALDIVLELKHEVEKIYTDLREKLLSSFGTEEEESAKKSAYLQLAKLVADLIQKYALERQAHEFHPDTRALSSLVTELDSTIDTMTHDAGLTSALVQYSITAVQENDLVFVNTEDNEDLKMSYAQFAAAPKIQERTVSLNGLRRIVEASKIELTQEQDTFLLESTRMSLMTTAFLGVFFDQSGDDQSDVTFTKLRQSLDVLARRNENASEKRILQQLMDNPAAWGIGSLYEKVSPNTLANGPDGEKWQKCFRTLGIPFEIQPEIEQAAPEPTPIQPPTEPAAPPVPEEPPQVAALQAETPPAAAPEVQITPINPEEAPPTAPTPQVDASTTTVLAETEQLAQENLKAKLDDIRTRLEQGKFSLDDPTSEEKTEGIYALYRELMQLKNENPTDQRIAGLEAAVLQKKREIALRYILRKTFPTGEVSICKLLEESIESAEKQNESNIRALGELADKEIDCADAINTLFDQTKLGDMDDYATVRRDTDSLQYLLLDETNDSELLSTILGEMNAPAEPPPVVAPQAENPPAASEVSPITLEEASAQLNVLQTRVDTEKFSLDDPLGDDATAGIFSVLRELNMLLARVHASDSIDIRQQISVQNDAENLKHVVESKGKEIVLRYILRQAFASRNTVPRQAFQDILVAAQELRNSRSELVTMHFSINQLLPNIPSSFASNLFNRTQVVSALKAEDRTLADTILSEIPTVSEDPPVAGSGKETTPSTQFGTFKSGQPGGEKASGIRTGFGPRKKT